MNFDKEFLKMILANTTDDPDKMFREVRTTAEHIHVLLNIFKESGLSPEDALDYFARFVLNVYAITDEMQV